MSRNVCIVSGKGGKYKYVRVCESYRNAEGKPRSRTIENHGSLDELLKKDPLYVEKLRERVAKENAAAKSALLGGLESSAQERIRRLETAAAGGPDYGHVKKLGLGSALLRQVWKEDLNLPQLFRYLQSKTKIEYSYEKAAFLLCAGRILNPGSKKRTFARKDRSIVPYDELSDINAVYRVLDRLAADKEAVVRHLDREIGKRMERRLTAAFYDVTTYAFESRTADELRDFGLSKDHKVNEVQVVLGLVMDEDGIPIDYELFPGCTSELGTMLPLIARIKKKHGAERLTVVADRGLNSNENLQGLKDLGCDFVIAQKVKSCSEAQKAAILNEENWSDFVLGDDGEILCKYKVMDVRKDIFETRLSASTGRKYTSSKKIDAIDVKWVVSHSLSRAAKDLAELDRAVEKAKKALKNKSCLSSRGYKSLISIPSEGTPTLNTRKIEEARKWAGYYAICTSLDKVDPKEIMRIYRNLWRIEDCFRISKDVLEARPCFVWTPDHIRGHFVSCYISLVLEKYMLNTLKAKLQGMTTEVMNEALREAEVGYDDGNPQMPVYLRLYPAESRFDEMLKVFGLEPPCRYEQKASLRKKLRLKQIVG